MTRIVIVSDTHNKLPKGFKIPDGDVLIHNGDFTMMGTVAEVSQFNEWLGTLPHATKLILAGNHDFLFERDRPLAKTILTNGRYMHNEELIIGDTKFYFTPYVPKLVRWAFYKDSAGLTANFAQIPDDVNFLITHGPPYGILDEVPVRGWSGYGDPETAHVGSVELFDRIMQLKQLKVSIFGHIHEAYGEKFFKGIHFINASICDEYYKAVNAPIVIDI